MKEVNTNKLQRVMHTPPEF